jgi:hypothetical protein
VKWQATYNSTYDHNDYGTAIAIDDDLNVYVGAASYTSATNYYDYLVIKYDSTGTELWTATYNGPGSLYDIPTDILVDASGNVYITGGSVGSATGWDYATIKYNSSSTKTIMKANSQGGEYHNFFLAHTGAAGITNVQKTDKLYTKDLYPKVDLMHAFDKAGVKYYLIIQPGYSQQNDPIEMVFNGAAITFNSDTTLTLETDIGGITLRKPEAYQIEADGSRTDMAWYPQYTNAGGGVVGFTLGSYTSSKELVLEFGLLPVEFEEGYYNEGIYWSTVYGIYNSGDKIVDCHISLMVNRRYCSRVNHKDSQLYPRQKVLET